MCFANADKTTKRASWFATAADAPINTATFEKGYTLETFVRIDPSYDPARNAWMTWLGRDGMRSSLSGYQGTEPDEPPMAWALSNLNEVQFAFTDASASREEASLWSGEIVNYTEWVHLAVVGDPSTGIATLYVDGVPMLRNAGGVSGLAHDAGLPWLMGAGTYGGVRDSGFVGCIGETRVVDRAIGPEEWLTARAPQDAPENPEQPAPEQPEQPEKPDNPGAPEKPEQPKDPKDPGQPGSPGGGSDAGTPGEKVPDGAASDDPLARTGTMALPVGLAAAALVVSGAVMLVLRRRRTVHRG